MYRKTISAFQLGALIAFVSGASVLADDWPQWRGPDRDGVWEETGIVTQFDSESLKPKWTTPVGSGYSGPTVSNGRVYLTSRLEKPEQVEQVHCVDEETGKELWKFVYPCEYQDIGYPLGPRAAVSIQDGKAYAFGAMGDLHCLDAISGKLMWKRQLVDEFDAKTPVWGLAASPLVDENHVYLQVGGTPNACIIALNKDDGTEVWRSLDGLASYVAPKFIEFDGKRLVFVWTANWFAALEPLSGAPVWKQAFERAKGPINVADPVLDPETNRLFFSSFYDGSYLFQLKSDPTATELVWSRRGRSEIHTDALQGIISTAFIKGDYVYGLDSHGELRCLNLSNGDRVWEDLTLLEKGRWATAFFIQNQDLTWIFTEKGELIVGSFSPEGFQRISSAKIIEPTTFLPRRSDNVLWSHPAFANRHIFVRNDRELIAVDLSE
jgi:outer membrane protein assembly factor BamB